MKKNIVLKTGILFVTACICLSLMGCTEAERVNYNITQEAEYFNVYRRVTVINCIKGDTLFTVEG